MKVLHLIKSLDRGGAEVLLGELARIAPARGLHVDVAWYLEQHRRMVPFLEEVGVRPTCLGARSTAGMFAKVDATVALLRRLRPDVVHAHLPIAGVVARVAAAAVGVPVVYTEHNVFDRYHPLTQAASLATWTLQRRVVAVSDVVATTLPRADVTGVPISVVKNGIPVERFVSGEAHRGAARRDLGVGDDDVVIGTVAVFRAAKRLERFVRAIELLRARGRRVHGVIAGYGPLEAELRAVVERSPARAHITLPGAVADVPRLLSAFDVWLLTSSHEGLPLALLEAMAAGRAVVATAVGGVVEVVDDGVNGRVVGVSGEDEFDDVFVGAVDALVVDADARAAFGAAARGDVRARFGVERMLDALVDVYNQVVDR